jgi:UDP-N-acetylglucosamine 2-epimerase (non-hydrolysing)
VREDLKVAGSDYAALTLHRPSNVDDPAAFRRILDALEQISRRIPIIFPVHPRTRARIMDFGFAQLVERASGLRLVEPLGYLDFLRLYSGARLVLTDSGGIQEETTALGIPCLTLRENTERPVTVELGTNTIVGTDTRTITEAAFNELDSPRERKAAQVPPLWDGKTADRILDAIIERMRDEG